jgi:probable addiction module antidote protein
MRSGKTTRAALRSVPFRAADHLRNDAEIALYIEEMLADGDSRAVTVALRTVADALGGMSALAVKTGLSRATLYRTLSDKTSPRLDALAEILVAFGLHLTVRPAGKDRTRHAGARVAPAMNAPAEPIDGSKAALLELRRAGVDALVRALGPVGMTRFLQQFGASRGDYTIARDRILRDATVDELSDEIERRRKAALAK